MATARHFGVKPVNQTYGIPGYGDEAYLLVQDAAADQNALGQVPSNPGVVWYVGPDESVHTQIIAYTVHDVEGSNGNSYPTLFNSLGDQGDDNDPGVANTARIAFKGSGNKTWSNAEFIALVDEIANITGNGPTAINTIDDAVNYINAGSHWTNFSASVEATTEAPVTTEAPTYFYAAVVSCDDTWSGVARSTQQLTRNAVYNVDTTSIYPPEAGEKVVVVNENAPSAPHDLEISDYIQRNCGIE